MHGLTEKMNVRHPLHQSLGGFLDRLRIQSGHQFIELVDAIADRDHDNLLLATLIQKCPVLLLDTRPHNSQHQNRDADTQCYP